EASLAVISGRRGSAPWQVVLPLGSAAPGQAIDRLWARFKVEALASGPRDERAAAKARRTVTDLGLRYGLVTEYTSLVAEDAVAADAGGLPQRAWVPLAEPASLAESSGAGDTLSLTGNPRVSRSIQTPIQTPAAAVAAGRKNAGQASIRARPDTTRAQLRRRLHHRRHRRHHRLHRRRHHRVRARVKVVPAVPVGEAQTPRARLGAQAQRR
ncbi:MAG TPA: hypothetical protein VGR07_06975, partial [Thermoanaerobaculia bacterium]|nr:hypothetical protein [Thermoanaerobaculia bacterium]